MKKRAGDFIGLVLGMSDLGGLGMAWMGYLTTESVWFGKRLDFNFFGRWLRGWTKLLGVSLVAWEIDAFLFRRVG